MLNKLFKDKKTRYRNLVIVLLPFIILMFVFGFTAYKSVSGIIGKGGEKVTFSNSIDSMDYHLRANATKLQKDLFSELSDTVKAGDKEKIAELVVKNYVADFYTWTNKNGIYDVGGMYYVYSPSKTNILVQARDTFYKYMSYYANEYGQENLLEVTSVEAEGGLADEKYEYEGKKYDKYYFVCNWTYSQNDKFDTSDFVTKNYITVIENEDGRFEIVEAYGDI